MSQKNQLMSHRIALPDFKILFSKLGNRKFNPTGTCICDEGAGLVAEISITQTVGHADVFIPENRLIYQKLTLYLSFFHHYYLSSHIK